MALSGYGVLAGRAVGKLREAGTSSPHFQVHLVDDGGTHYRIAVNVLSQDKPSDLLYLAIDDFRHPITDRLPAAGSGWNPLASTPDGGGLDLIRGNLFDHTAMVPLPPDIAGPDNDLEDRLEHYVDRAIADPGVALYAFGQRWGPEQGLPDKIFNFQPGNGVHDIHMNQGNTPDFAKDDGVWQDGGLIFHLPAPQPHWAAIFLAFQSQAWHTDDTTGHAIPGPAPTPAPGPAPGPVPTPAPTPPPAGQAPLRIIAALANPVGPAPEAETVTLLNVSPAPVDLSGWSLADRTKRRLRLPAATLAAGATLTVPLAPPIALGNGGGIITLLDPAGLKIHGVSYTAAQAAAEGWTIPF